MTIQKPYIIIGAGISGLTIATALHDKGIPEKDILIIEANKQIGGMIDTDREQGYTAEWGPEGLRGKSDQTQWIVDHIDQEIIPASDQSEIRYIGRDDDLVKVPTGPLSAIFTGLIPFTGKLRILKEPFVKPVEEDETLATFVERRLGKHIVPLVDAFVTGVFGGDPYQLSTEHSFPIMKELERDYGSLIKGGMKYSKKKKAEKSEEEIESEEEIKPPFLVTTDSGMMGILNDLAEPFEINLDERVESITVKDGTYDIITGENTYNTQNLFVATGVNAINQIKLHEFGDISPLPNTKEAKVLVVTLGFDKSALPEDLEGYGFLIPDSENRFIMGALFSSLLFNFRAPENKIMLRVFVGGIRHLDRVEMDKDTILDNVLSDLDDFIGLNGEPEFVSLLTYAPERGIPQLNLGHEKILEWREKAEIKNPGLKFAGIGWEAISCDKLIAESREIVENTLNKE